MFARAESGCGIQLAEFEAFRAAVREVHIAEARAAVVRLAPERPR